MTHVSVSTVSKVLNGRPGVSPETRAVVQRALRRHGYERRTAPFEAFPTVEVLCYEMEAPFAAALLRDLEAECRIRGAALVISRSENNQRPPEGWVSEVLQRKSRAVVAVGTELSSRTVARLRAESLPIVLINPSGNVESGVSYVGSSDRQGAYDATIHLLRLGHRELGMITGPPSMPAARHRQSGFLTALAKAGITIRAERCVSGRFCFEDGLAGGLRLLAMNPRPTAIFAASDPQALGVYQAAQRMGLRVPEDLSVVGYDNLPIAEWASPPLTTVRVPTRDMARAAVRVALDPAQAASDAVQERVALATEIVVRASTAALKV